MYAQVELVNVACHRACTLSHGQHASALNAQSVVLQVIARDAETRYQDMLITHKSRTAPEVDLLYG